MDGRTKPDKFYVVDCNNNTLYEDNQENSNETLNDTEGWGENGAVAKVNQHSHHYQWHCYN